MRPATTYEELRKGDKQAYSDLNFDVWPVFSCPELASFDCPLLVLIQCRNNSQSVNIAAGYMQVITWLRIFSKDVGGGTGEKIIGGLTVGPPDVELGLSFVWQLTIIIPNSETKTIIAQKRMIRFINITHHPKSKKSESDSSY